MTAGDHDPTVATDVLVVGGGGAGMTAALTAARTAPDATVALLERRDELGGTTAIAVGSFSAAETELQRAAGVEDTTDAHFEDVGKFVEAVGDSPRSLDVDCEGSYADHDDLALRRTMVEHGPATLEWLREQGIEYSGPHPEPPHRVPRMHNVQPDGTAYRDVLGEALDDAGVTVHNDCEATALLTTEGRVVGVRTATGEEFAASAGVVLATGSFVANRDLRSTYTGDATAPPVNEMGTGAGQDMASEAGAQLRNMDLQWRSFRFGDPLWTEPQIPALVDAGALLVDADGERFVDETADYDQLFEATRDVADGGAFLLFDDEVARTFQSWPDYVSTFPGSAYAYLADYAEYDVLQSAPDLAALAGSSDLPAEGLEATVAAANRAAAGERVDTYGRTSFAGPLGASPYYLLGPFHPVSLITDGGVAVNSHMEALDQNGSPVDGLYAVGDTAAGPLRAGHGHHHLWLFTSGRIAGREVLGA